MSRFGRTRAKAAWRVGAEHLALTMAAMLGGACVVAARLQGGSAVLAWLGLLPLLAAVLLGRPFRAGLIGATWGAVIAFLSTYSPDSYRFATAPAVVLLTIVPAIYVAMGSLMTRAIGFNPLMLALAWILVEVVLRPLRLPLGLVAGAAGDSLVARWVTGVLGYAFVGLLMILAHASILKWFMAARWKSAYRTAGCRITLVAVPIRLRPQVLPPNTRLDCSPARPRAPPFVSAC